MNGCRAATQSECAPGLVWTTWGKDSTSKENDICYHQLFYILRTRTLLKKLVDLRMECESFMKDRLTEPDVYIL